MDMNNGSISFRYSYDCIAGFEGDVLSSIQQAVAITLKMVVNITKHHINRCDALIEVCDIELIRDTYTTMHLHRFMSDMAGQFANIGFGA